MEGSSILDKWKTPNQVTWIEYKCYYSRPVWENVGVAYNSALWYITYK